VINGESKELQKKIDKAERDILVKLSPNIWNVHTDGNMEKKMEVDFKMY
jgi:hypothetical protein